MSVPFHSHNETLPASVPENETLRHRTPATEIDHSLVQRFVNGDETAFLEIMERYRGKLFGVTLALLRNHADAEEITQDAFIRAHRGLVNFRGDSSLSTWLHRIAINLARNRYWYFVRRKRQDTISLDCALTDGNAATFSDVVADVGYDPAQETVAREFSTMVDRCMAVLDAHHREILILRNELHRSYDQIAVTLQINVGTVKSRIARARENLRVLLAQTFTDSPADTASNDWFLHRRTAHGAPSIACA